MSYDDGPDTWRHQQQGEFTVGDYFVLAMSPSLDSYPVGDSTPLKSQIRDELARAETPITVGELTDRLLDRYDIAFETGDAIDSWGRLHQHLYRDELQRLASKDVVVFDPNSGLVALHGPEHGTGADEMTLESQVRDGDRIPTTGELAANVPRSMGEFLGRIDELPLYYGGLAVLVAGLLWLLSVGPTGRAFVLPTAILVLVTIGLGAAVLAQRYRR